MNRAVMLSVRPAWCERIASGKKTIEVRKTRPKLATPFKCYIYMSHGYLPPDSTLRGREGFCIGEFVCDRVDVWNTDIHDNDSIHLEDLAEKSCVSEDDLMAYADRGHLYGWHISALQIYDRPKELGEFYRHCIGYDVESGRWCPECADTRCSANGKFYLTRPPQSWGYVEELNKTI